jgi:leader peptidase (prepilin peptidase) / N-methyltransferase
VNPLWTDYGPLAILATAVGGLLVGSFVNVLVHRLPRGESIVFPGSHCPACGAPIAPWDNIPVLSWILLGGRCRACRAPIAWRYPMLELANGALWVLLLWRARSWPELSSGAFLCSACLALLAIDAEFQILPDKITLTGIAVGLAFALLTRRFPSALLGAAVGAGGLFLLAFVYERMTRREGMGLGDVKMLGMIGAFLGASGVLVTVLLASLSGSIVGLTLIAMGRGDRQMRLPFGVFLSFGAIAALFFGADLIQVYRAVWP